MAVTGIIMECNPFHEGHAYLLREARRRTGADYVVVAMSGDFVQRGEPAVFDKYLRAEQILRAGADLVLEMPLYAACGSAEYFARGGISLLEAAGVVTDLCFGSESGDTAHLMECARLLEAAEKESPQGGGKNSGARDGSEKQPAAPSYREGLLSGLRAGLPFPAARDAALCKALPASPNDLLGAEYCRALLSTGSSIRPLAIPRIDAPSATSRRRALLENRGPSLQHRREGGVGAGQGGPAFPLGPDDFSSYLIYALRMEEELLEQYVDVSPDFADRIRNLLPAYRSYTQFTDLLKTRNLTRTRVSRSLLHILLRMRKDRLSQLEGAGFSLYLRPLALRREAAPLLSSVRRSSSAPFLPKLSRAGTLLSPAALGFLKEEIRAQELYGLALYAAGGSPRCSRAAQRRLTAL